MKLNSVPSFISKTYGFLLAVLAIAGITLLLLPFRAHLSASTVALLYLLPVLLISTMIGLSGGLFSALVSFFTFNYFFLKPYYTLTVHETQDLISLSVFFLVAILLSQLVGRVQENLKGLMTREVELVTLYELTLALSGQNQIQDIAEILATHIKNDFKADWVEVLYQFDHAGAPITYRCPENYEGDLSTPTGIIALESPHNHLGTIRIGRGSLTLSSNEMRKLRTFANQGTMALERALLSEAETKAKVFEESDRLKSSLLSSVSHEFNTPLATIKASITSLLGGEVTWDSISRNELLSIVNEETDHLIYLVSNLLNMSRIESNALKPILQWNMLAEIVDSTIVRMERKLEKHIIEVSLPEDLPLVPVDYVQMQQVFINLFSNCVKYAPEGTKIRVSAEKISETVQVSIENQSPPVPPENLDRIFDKFYRLTQTEKVFGTGLGLSICKGIIESHGGRIWAENLPNGFVFRFTLPLELMGAAQQTIPEV